jgi:hypothetical protein
LWKGKKAPPQQGSINQKRRVESILDRALGSDSAIEKIHPEKSTRLSPIASPSKFSLKNFSRDDSMYSEPESIRADVDRQVRLWKSRDKERNLNRVKSRIALSVEDARRSPVPANSRDASPVTPPQPVKPDKKWIIKDDLDEPLLSEMDWDKVDIRRGPVPPKGPRNPKKN